MLVATCMISRTYAYGNHKQIIFVMSGPRFLSIYLYAICSFMYPFIYPFIYIFSDNPKLVMRRQILYNVLSNHQQTHRYPTNQAKLAAGNGLQRKPDG